MSCENLKQDIAELEQFQKQATRPKVKDILMLEVRKLQTELIKLVENEQKESTPSKPTSTVVRPVGQYTTEIKTYAWDQSDKFTKIYITLKDVHKLDKENVTSEFTDKSFKVCMNNLDNKNHFCRLSHLFDTILPEGSYHKVKTDMVLLMLKKKETKTWAYVTEQEKKAKDKKVPKSDDKKEKDPSDGLMDMMKQMYDDGDDDMKKTIAKAWTESRDKGGQNPGMMPGMM